MENRYVNLLSRGLYSTHNVIVGVYRIRVAEKQVSSFFFFNGIFIYDYDRQKRWKWKNKTLKYTCAHVSQ